MAGRGSFKPGEGDWTCGGCFNINFARRQKCNQCQKPKDQATGLLEQASPFTIGSAGAAKSGGLFSANDWKCPMCANINWAKRDKCNECQAPRPGGAKEHREGRGGGFNEREGVSYKERTETDDGEIYDDMGRLKKKFRLKNRLHLEDGLDQIDSSDPLSAVVVPVAATLHLAEEIRHKSPESSSKPASRSRSRSRNRSRRRSRSRSRERGAKDSRRDSRSRSRSRHRRRSPSRSRSRSRGRSSRSSKSRERSSRSSRRSRSVSRSRSSRSRRD